MWRKANLRRWIRAFRRHPKVGLAGFVVGLLDGAMTTYFDQLSGYRAGLSPRIFAWQNVSPVVTAVLGLAFFIWISGTLRLPQKRSAIAVFLISFFPGALVEVLFSTIFNTVSRMIA
jgi:hypothetical protein